MHTTSTHLNSKTCTCFQDPLPLEAIHHQQVLSLYGRIVRRYKYRTRTRPTTTSHERQTAGLLQVESFSSNVIELLQGLPSTECWKKTYKEAIKKMVAQNTSSESRENAQPLLPKQECMQCSPCMEVW